MLEKHNEINKTLSIELNAVACDDHCSFSAHFPSDRVSYRGAPLELEQVGVVKSCFFGANNSAGH